MSNKNHLYRYGRLSGVVLTVVCALFSNLLSASEPLANSYVYGVAYLGTAHADTDSVRIKLAQRLSAPMVSGRIQIRGSLIEYAAPAPKPDSRYVKVVVLGRSHENHIRLLEKGKVLAIEGHERVWLFYKDSGFSDSETQGIIASLVPSD